MQIDHRKRTKTVHLPTGQRFANNHSFMVFIIIPMIYQVDRARRKEVAVKVKESKDYTFRDEVRSSGMIEFMRNFSWSVYHYQLNGRGDALALCSTVAAFLTNSKTSDLGWSWWVFEEGPGARLPTPEHCGKAKNDCWKGVNFIFGIPLKDKGKHLCETFFLSNFPMQEELVKTHVCRMQKQIVWNLGHLFNFLKAISLPWWDLQLYLLRLPYSISWCVWQNWLLSLLQQERRWLLE